MGVIRVKLANNYIPLPIPAAANYFEQHKTVNILSPGNLVPGTWKIANLVNLQKGFGAYAKTKGGYWGFVVCFLLNQATGYTELYLKHLNEQNANGDLTDNYLKWWEAGNLQDLGTWAGDANRGFASNSGTFVHPAWLAVNRLNEISLQDENGNIDFTYPSPIHQDQPNYYLNDTNTNVPLRKRTQQTSQRTELVIPGTQQEENEGFGAYGDNPWPKCSMRSFFSVTAVSDSSIANLEENMAETVDECYDEQQDEWETQWDIIQSEGGGPS